MERQTSSGRGRRHGSGDLHLTVGRRMQHARRRPTQSRRCPMHQQHDPALGSTRMDVATATITCAAGRFSVAMGTRSARSTRSAGRARTPPVGRDARRRRTGGVQRVASDGASAPSTRHTQITDENGAPLRASAPSCSWGAADRGPIERGAPAGGGGLRGLLRRLAPLRRSACPGRAP